MARLDAESVERLRAKNPKDAFRQVKDSVYRAGAISSEDFLNAFEQLVEEGILTWDQIEEFERE